MKKRELMKKQKCTGEPGSPEKNKRINFRTVFSGLISLFLLCMCIPTVAYAGAIQDTQLVQGAKNLLSDLATAGLFLEAAALGFIEIKEGIAMQAASAEEKAKHKKNMITAAGVGILIICVTALIPVVFSYFQ